MNLSTECLGTAQVELLLQGNLTPEEYATAQEHMEVCGQCRRRIEETIGPEPWWGDVASALSNHVATSLRDVDQRRDDDRESEPASLGETRLRESVLDLLGPTDDPNMLGRIGP
ncbi:MAG: hypothetical protein ABL921_20180 [Pirellula sp.]